MFLILTILGLAAFEVISGIDNAVINAHVINTMEERSKKWFLFWGMLFAVFVVRGIMPFLIIWSTMPQFSALDAFLASFSGSPEAATAIQTSAPLLLIGGGVFLLLIFTHWLFIEEKHFVWKFEKFFNHHAVWFYATASIMLTTLVWLAIKHNPLMTLAATIGSTAFFITHGFKQQAEIEEQRMANNKQMSDISKILYLEVLDATFSIDGVLGAFAFTFSIPLILIGNGIGAFIVREITIKYANKIAKYVYLKNGAMYSIFFLGLFMVLESFDIHIPEYTSPVITLFCIVFFFYKSIKNIENIKK
ncbi:MAG TPA: DUF475 domain-containing protein [Rickettsiales bacterium]|nr:DUF475 domain-containing protein [Rickettsiales bacterium]